MSKPTAMHVLEALKIAENHESYKIAQFEEWEPHGLYAPPEYNGKMKDLMGKVLTVIDASLHEERANKAVKDMIKSTFKDSMKAYEQSLACDLHSLNRKVSVPAL